MNKEGGRQPSMQEINPQSGSDKLSPSTPLDRSNFKFVDPESIKGERHTVGLPKLPTVEFKLGTPKQKLLALVAGVTFAGGLLSLRAANADGDRAVTFQKKEPVINLTLILSWVKEGLITYQEVAAYFDSMRRGQQPPSFDFASIAQFIGKTEAETIQLFVASQNFIDQIAERAIAEVNRLNAIESGHNRPDFVDKGPAESVDGISSATEAPVVFKHPVQEIDSTIDGKEFNTKLDPTLPAYAISNDSAEWKIFFEKSNYHDSLDVYWWDAKYTGQHAGGGYGTKPDFGGRNVVRYGIESGKRNGVVVPLTMVYIDSSAKKPAIYFVVYDVEGFFKTRDFDTKDLSGNVVQSLLSEEMNLAIRKALVNGDTTAAEAILAQVKSEHPEYMREVEVKDENGNVKKGKVFVEPTNWMQK